MTTHSGRRGGRGARSQGLGLVGLTVLSVVHKHLLRTAYFMSFLFSQEVPAVSGNGAAGAKQAGPEVLPAPPLHSGLDS